MSTTAVNDAEARWQRASRTGTVYLTATFVVVVLVALIPLFGTTRFYFQDDTQSSAVGAWYELGRYLATQHSIPLMLPTRFMAGNILAEGQWAVFNPLALVLALITYTTGQLLLIATAVKVLSLGVLGVGTYLVARSYYVEPRWAAAFGMVTPFIGFTLYFDAPSWVTGLWVFAGLTWSWWAMRRFRLIGGLPVLPFLCGYLVITVGYVHGTLMLAVLMLGLITEAWLTRDRVATLRLLALGVAQGLVAAFVFLPGLLTAKVTWRTGQGIGNDNFLSADPSVLLTSFVATYRAWLLAFWGTGQSGAPLTFISWMPLLLILLDWRGLIQTWRTFAAPIVLWAASFALAFGPSVIGPLRFPIRLMPYLGLATIILTAILVSRSVLVVTKSRVVALAVVGALGLYLSVAEFPRGGAGQLASVALACGGVLGMAWLNRARPALLPTLVAVLTVGTLGLQIASAPKTPLPDFGLPGTAAAYRGIVPTDAGAIYAAGDPRTLNDPWAFTSLGNGWSISGASSANVYSPVGFAAIGDELCIETHGVACPAGAKKVFAVDPTTGRTVADLLGFGLVQVLGSRPAALPPDGWRVVSRNDQSVLWQRTTSVQDVGSVAWTQPGVQLTRVSNSDREVSFTVESAPADGGKVVLSRLAWPGYTTNGGTIVDPLRGYLLTVEVGPTDVGKTITLSFSPPAWALTAGCLVVAFAIVLCWSLVLLVRRSRRKLNTHSQPRK